MTTILTALLKRLEHVEYKVDWMEKAFSSRLDGIDERLGLLEGSCSSIHALVMTIHKATEDSFAPIAQVAQIKVNTCSIECYCWFIFRIA